MSNTRGGRDQVNVSADHGAINIGQESNVAINIGDHSRGEAASGSNEVHRDLFQPSFHAPSNPEEVVLDYEEAKDMLLRYSKFNWKQLEQDKARPAFDKLLRMCSGLPIFLAVVGKAVAKIAQRFKHKNERVSAWEKCVTIIEDSQLLETMIDGYKGLGRMLHMSLKLLSEDCGQLLEGISPYSLSEMHRALCVFKKQTAIPISVCRRLWKVDSYDAAMKFVMAFANLGLADIEIERKGDRHVGLIRMHDLILKFAVQCAKAAGEVRMWHERLLEGYISKPGGGESVRQWWDVEEKSGEEYLFENLCRHLVHSGNVKELAGLLLCGEWTIFRHKYGGLSSWKHDCSEYLGRKMVVSLSQSEKEIESGVRMVKDAVLESWAFVHQNLDELGFQIFGRLVDCKNSTVEKYMESLERVHCGAWLKPMKRCWTQPGEGGMKAEFHFEGYVRDMAVQKEAFIAAVAAGKEIAIIDLKEMAVKSTCIGHTEDVKKVAISIDGKRVFSWSLDCTVQQWDLQSGNEAKYKCLRLKDEESEEDDEVTCGEFFSDESYVITGSRKGKVKVWDLSTGARTGYTMYATGSVSCIEVSPNGRTIAVGTERGTILLWDLQTCTPLGEEPKRRLYWCKVRSIAFSSDGRFAASVDEGIGDSLIRLWSIEDKTEAKGRFSHRACRVAFSQDDQQIICGQYDGSIAVCDVASGALIRSWKAHGDCVFGWVNCMAASGDPGSPCAVITWVRRTMRVWDLQEAANVTDEGIQHESRIYCVAASPDGHFFVSASHDRTLRIWSAADGTALGEPLCGHEDGVVCVAVSPDNLRLVSGSWDRTVRVWDVTAGAQVGNAIQGHDEVVNCVAYSKDGRFVVSGSEDCTVRIWRVTDSPQIDEYVGEPKTTRVGSAEPEARELLSSPQPLRLEMILNHWLPDVERKWERSVTSVSMSPDGQRLVCGLHNGEIWVWVWSSGEWIHRTRSHNVHGIIEIEISEKNEVVTANWNYEYFRWRLDDGGGLTRVPGNVDNSEVAQAEEQERPVCYQKTVWLKCSGKKIATLPEVVNYCAWKYDAQRRVLCAGLEDGRVLFFQVQI